MNKFVKLVPVCVVAALLLLAAGCGGGPSSDTREGDDAYVLSAADALGRSASDFQQNVESMQGEMSIEMGLGEAGFGLEGDFAFQSPDRMHLRMEFTGGGGPIDVSQFGEIEMLMDGQQVYMKMPFVGGWVTASLDDMGLDAEQLREMLEDGSPFDYAQLISSLGDGVNVQDLGEEESDGRSLRRYRITSDFQTLFEAIAGTLGNDFDMAELPVDSVSGPVALDLWLDTETFLPYKMVAEGSMATDSQSFGQIPGEMTFSMTMIVNEYNGTVQIPEPPEDAIDISEMGEDVFGAGG